MGIPEDLGSEFRLAPIAQPSHDIATVDAILPRLCSEPAAAQRRAEDGTRGTTAGDLPENVRRLPRDPGGANGAPTPTQTTGGQRKATTLSPIQ